MSDLVTTARTARERLSVGLNALQDPGLPESLQSAAEPIAQAMSTLLQIERTGAIPITKASPSALDLVRQALARLQSQPMEHPALFQAMESVAGSLGLVYGLVQRVSSAPPPAQSAATSSNAQRLVASPAVAAAPRVAPAQPVPTSSQQIAASPVASRSPMTGSAPAASVPRPMSVQPEATRAQAQVANTSGTLMSRQSASASVSSAVAAAMQIPAGGNFTSAQTMVAGGTGPTPGSTPPAAKVPSSPPPAMAPAAPTANNASTSANATGASKPAAPAAAAAAAPLASSGTPLQRVAAELGAHSATNFYKGLSGNDVVDSGGIFIATYQIPPIGKQLLIRVSLPGGYEFEAKAIVRWTRDANSSGGDLVSPGFGAQFTEISPEARQLVYRYARNREPLFHDDL